MRTLTCLLHTGAGIGLVNPTLLAPQWTNRIKLRKMLHLRTATQGPLRMERTILLYVRLSDLFVRVWFGHVRSIAVNTLFSPSYFDLFKRRIFPAKRKAV